MRQFLAACLLVCGLGGLAQAEESLPDAAAQAAIRAVIEQQIDAFRRDDGTAAFGYASPQIQAMFGDPDNFMRMVRSGYPQVYRPRHLEFQGMRQVDGRLIQPVLVIGPDGVPVLALYVMALQPDGKWRIDGCTLAAIADKAA